MTEDDPPTGERTQETTDLPADRDPGPNAAGNATNHGADGTDARDESSTHAGEPATETLLTDARRIEGSIRWKWGLGAVLSAAVVGVVVGAISVVGLEWGPVPGVGIALLVVILGVGHVLLLYRSWTYEVRADALYLERGVLTHVKTVVPFVRVQHIDTSRGPIDRVIGLSSLVVYTAGSRGADVTIPGLTPEDAEDLQDRLKTLARESTGDDAV